MQYKPYPDPNGVVRKPHYNGKVGVGAEMNIDGRQFRHALLIADTPGKTDAELWASAAPKFDQWAKRLTNQPDADIKVLCYTQADATVFPHRNLTGLVIMHPTDTPRYVPYLGTETTLTKEEAIEAIKPHTYDWSSP